MISIIIFPLKFFSLLYQSNIFLRFLAKDSPAFSQLKRKVSSNRFEQLRVWKRVNTPVWSIGHSLAHLGQFYLLYQNLLDSVLWSQEQSMIQTFKTSSSFTDHSLHYNNTNFYLHNYELKHLKLIINFPKSKFSIKNQKEKWKINQ